MSGLPCRAIASSRAATQKSASIVFDSRQASTLRLNQSMMARPYELAGARAFAVEGSPVDCVRLGRYLAEDEPIDFCLSGINDGTNLGAALYYSGTAAAAREAAMLNIPSMALSIGVNASEAMIENLANFALDLLPYFKEKTLPRLTFLNINAEAIPPEQLKGARLCPISDSFFIDRYVQRVNPRGVPYFWIEAGAQTEAVKPGTDIDLCEQGYITCTFVGGFTDNNHLFEGMLGTRED